MNYKKQFIDAIASAGLVPPEKLIIDGEIHRFSSNGKPNDDAGWYSINDEYIPVGAFGCWRSGVLEKWRADIGRDLSPDEHLHVRERAESQRLKREAEKESRYKDAKIRADDIWSNAQNASDHEYLIRKKIKANGVRSQGSDLIVPVRQGKQITSLQFITHAGEKRFLAGGQVQGSYFSIGDLEGAAALCICEGFATGASIHEATGLPVAVAFNAGNLLAVSETLRLAFPNLPIILCADDDYATDGNPGLTKAKEAAIKIGGRLAIPQFGANRPDKATDFNDLALYAGNDLVKDCIDRAIGDSNEAGGTPSLEKIDSNLLSAQEEWAEPLPIPTGLLPVEPFDFKLLPESIREWVQDITERMQCPPDFTAVGAMVSLASLIGRKVSIKPKRFDDWTVMPNLWGVVVGRPGVMKSPALAETIKPLDRLAARANSEHAAMMAEYAITKDLDELAEKADKNRVAAALKKGNRDEAERLLRASSEVIPLNTPVLRRYKVVDATYESLGQVLIENPLGVLVYRDEITGLLRGLDKEGQEGARAFYLQGYDGNQSYTFDRIIRGGNLTIPAVCISMLGGIQPAKLQRYIHDAVNGGSGDDGLLQRFGLLVWPDVTREWRNVDKYPNNEAKQKASAVYERLDGIEVGFCDETSEPFPHVYRFSAEAQDLFDQWRHEFESSLRCGDYHPAMESHLAKYRKLIPAIALVCAVADGEEIVSYESLMRALGWAEYLQSHAERVYGAGIRPATDGATALLKKIKSGSISQGFKPSDVYLKGWSSLSTEETLSAINILCELGYLREQKTSNPAGGRPSKTYLINPLVTQEGI